MVSAEPTWLTSCGGGDLRTSLLAAGGVQAQRMPLHPCLTSGRLRSCSQPFRDVRARGAAALLPLLLYVSDGFSSRCSHACAQPRGWVPG
jgi:hypothetical protein